MNIDYPVPKIVHVNQIIKKFFFDIIEGRKDNQMLKILECANV